MSNLPVRQDFMASRPAADAQRFFAMGPLSELASHRCTRAKQGLGRIQQSFRDGEEYHRSAKRIGDRQDSDEGDDRNRDKIANHAIGLQE